MGKYDLALADYNSAIETDSEPTSTNLLARAKVYDTLGKPDLANKDRAMAKKLDSTKF